MYKYVPIDKVLTRIPEALLEEESDSKLIRWALKGYKQNVKHINTTHETKFCISQLKDHKAKLPVGFKQLYEFRYSDVLPTELGENNSTIYTVDTYNGEHVIIFQGILFQKFAGYSERMKFAGQNTDVVHNSCVNILCQDCINYSISHDLSTLTADVKEGYVLGLYMSNIEDEGTQLIVDDPTLIDALAEYCIAQHYLNASLRRESNAYEMNVQHLMRANNLFQEFENRNLLRKFDAEKFVLNNILINRLPQIDHQITRNR